VKGFVLLVSMKSLDYSISISESPLTPSTVMQSFLSNLRIRMLLRDVCVGDAGGWLLEDGQRMEQAQVRS